MVGGCRGRGGGDQNLAQVEPGQQVGDRGELTGLRIHGTWASAAPLAWSSTDTRCTCPPVLLRAPRTVLPSSAHTRRCSRSGTPACGVRAASCAHAHALNAASTATGSRHLGRTVCSGRRDWGWWDAGWCRGWVSPRVVAVTVPGNLTARQALRPLRGRLRRDERPHGERAEVPLRTPLTGGRGRGSPPDVPSAAKEQTTAPLSGKPRILVTNSYDAFVPTPPADCPDLSGPGGTPGLDQSKVELFRRARRSRPPPAPSCRRRRSPRPPISARARAAPRPS